MTRPRRRLLAGLAVVASLTGSACSGPKLPLEVFVKEDPIDITFGEQTQAPPPPARPPGAEVINPGFPSFVAPPPPRVVVVPAVDSTRTTVAARPPAAPPTPACPAPDPFETPDTTTTSIARPPTEGVYAYRRSGVSRVKGVETALPPLAFRQIRSTQTFDSPRGRTWQFNVLQREVSPGTAALAGGVETLTETRYEIDPNGGTQPYPVVDTERVAGVKIVAIATESPDGVDSFQPRPAVRFLTLPAGAKSYAEGASGTDPLTGLALDVRFQTLERAEVEGCGTVFQAWKQRVEGVYYDSASPPDVSNEGLWFTSTLYIANHLGGLILKDELHLSDRPPKDSAAPAWDLQPGVDIDVRSVSTINSVTPEKAPR